MQTFRQKVVSGLTWNTVNIFTKQGLSLLVHVTLARLLLPSDFGIIGMITIFLDMSLRLQGAGLGESLIRKKAATQAEYNFVFFYGLAIGTLCYLVLFFLAPAISYFYREPRLTLIIRVITLNLMLIPLRGMNRVQLIKNLDFQKIARVEILSGIGAGLVAILLAYKGFGVWSLVIQHLCQHTFSMALFVVHNRWFPTLVINRSESKALFSFGSRLMASNFIEIGFKNIYHVIIGRQYAAGVLGYYTQGLKLQRLPATAVNSIIKGVSFPAFAEIRKDRVKYLETFRKTMRLLTFINFPLLIALAAAADPLIPLLLSDKWIPTIPFFQMLVVIGLIEPVKSLFVNILKVEGRADLLIKYVTFTKLFHFIGIAIALKINIYALIASQVLATVLELIVFSRIGGLIQYNGLKFLKDILPNLFLAIAIGGAIWLLNRSLPAPSLALLGLDVLAGLILGIILSKTFGNPSFAEIRREITTRLKK